MSVKHYKDLVVWQKAMDLVLLVYRASKAFPADERFGLTAQLRRSAVSVPSNIAEGQARGTSRDFCNFLCIARGSLQEMETQLLIVERLDYLVESDARAEIANVIAEVGRLLNGLLNSLTNKN